MTKKHPLSGRKQTEEHIKKRVEARKKNGTTGRGKKLSPEHLLTLKKAMQKFKGKKRSPQIGAKVSETKKRLFREGKLNILSGKNHYNWQGGKTKESKRIRNSYKYKDWRKSVFERDDYTCQICGERGGYIEADHIKPFAIYPKLRFDINNGRTLCKPCHKKTPTWGWKMRWGENV